MSEQAAIDELNARVAGALAVRASRDVLQAMGYRRIDDARRARLARVAADPLLGMDRGGFDFRYDSAGFARALCDALRIAPNISSRGLAAIQRRVARRRAFAPWVFVETGFTRGGQSILSLAAMEGHRRLALARSFCDLSPSGRIDAAGRLVAAHHRACEGRLPLWGEITGYRLHHLPGMACRLDPAGRYLGPVRGLPNAPATSSAGGVVFGPRGASRD